MLDIEKDFEKNIEKMGYDSSSFKIEKESMSVEDMFYIYYDILYRLKSKEDVCEIINKDNYKSKKYNDLHTQRDLLDQQIENPPKMRDGVAPCPKCKLNKTVISEHQGRSCDEGFTYELHCYNKKCKLVKTRDFKMN